MQELIANSINVSKWNRRPFLNPHFPAALPIRSIHHAPTHVHSDALLTKKG